MKKRKKDSQALIKGIIIPSQWDDKGKIIGVSINSNDEKAYLIEPIGAGKDLLNLIHQKLAVRGKVRQRIDGNKLIRVTDCKTIEE
ncbi:MAG: hypothetical protein H8E17_05595 [Deltaproteobacteria bacterium]|nr:hypothetical protein [Deltaproteobacteria bacterium]